MAKGLFVTGTGTDIGKTYVTALLIKKMRSLGLDTGYYKAAISGAPSVGESDAGYVNRAAGINEKEELLLSYLYTHAVSPHLAARLEGHPVQKEKVLKDWERVKNIYPYVVVEGSGGIVCPIRHDEEAVYYLTDIVRWLGIPSVIVSPAGLGSINNVVLTAFYMKEKGLLVNGIILNHYHGGVMEEDNIKMMEELTDIPVLAKVKDGDRDMEISGENILALLGEKL